jgi:hypothetical protein
MKSPLSLHSLPVQVLEAELAEAPEAFDPLEPFDPAEPPLPLLFAEDAETDEPPDAVELGNWQVLFTSQMS